MTNLNITVGQYANEGREVLSLVDNRTWYVVANFRENFLGHIRPGMSAEVYLLSYPNKRFRGRVQGVGWALYQNNGASVQGLPQVEETLNWVRLSQRFPVRIILENGDPAFPFRMGATAVVTIAGRSVTDGSMAGFVKPQLRVAQPFGWLDQLEALLARELAPTSRKFRTAFRLTTIATIGAGLVAICHVNNELGTYIVWLLVGAGPMMSASQGGEHFSSRRRSL